MVNGADPQRQFNADGTLASKVCSRCGERKAAASFAVSGVHKDGRKAVCKTCTNRDARNRRTRQADGSLYTCPGMGGWRCLHHVWPVAPTRAPSPLPNPLPAGEGAFQEAA